MRKRLELIDALRGFALFGILIVNLFDFTLHFRFGPVEWLWRSLTYGKRQPLARRNA